MRFFETGLLLLLALSFLLPLARRRSEKWQLWLHSGVVLALFLHLGLEGYRWQMMPLYLLTAGVALWTLRFKLSAEARLGRGALAGLALALGLCLPAGLLPMLFPVPQLPAPNGPNPVGTFAAMLVDESRRELYSGNPDEARALMVQVWYPAQEAAGLATAPWLSRAEVVAPAISRWLNYPEFFLDHVRLADSHALLEAPLAASPQRLPVITFSHGWNGVRQQSTFLMEELASYGYVVVSIEHSYGARIVVFPDGRVAENNPRALPYQDAPEVLEPAADMLGNQWAEDIGFVLDTLAQWNVNDPNGRLSGRLDLSRVGVSGHSTGAGAATEFCGRDRRCVVLVGLDAYLTPVSEAVLAGGLSQPALLLFSEAWPSETNQALLARLMSASPGARQASILGTAHYDFTDLPLLTPLAPALGLKGPLKAEVALEIIRQATLATFEAALNGGEVGKLERLAEVWAELRLGGR